MLQEQTEKQLLAKVRDAAALGGWLCYHTHDSRRSEPGFPDLVLVRDADMIAVEMKSATGRVSEHQSKWVKALSMVGHVRAYVVRGNTETDALCDRLLSPRAQLFRESALTHK